MPMAPEVRRDCLRYCRTLVFWAICRGVQIFRSQSNSLFGLNRCAGASLSTLFMERARPLCRRIGGAWSEELPASHAGADQETYAVFASNNGSIALKEARTFETYPRRSSRERYHASMRLTYVMKFVSSMDTAVKFYRDTLGLPLKFQSPGWSEFATGDITLALHPASEKNPPGEVELGFSVEDLKAFHADLAAKGVQFPMPPKVEDFGALAQFLDSEGAACSVAQEKK